MSSIKGTNVLAPVVPFDTTDSHASHEARYGRGGYRSVADIAERDAIPALRREAGMLVLTMSDGKVWRLAADLAAWSEISLAGPQGPQGVAGVAGPQGIPGVAGAAGAQGPAGPAGAAGVAGAKGDTGERGPAGPAGEAGPQGIQGVAGVAGAKGDTGSQGPAGPAGPQGIQGNPGVAGATGPAGAAGAKGDTGSVGPQGEPGVAGAVGPAGPAGVAGATGVQGPQGVAGATGSVGPQGPAGATGATGSQGPAASLVYSSITDFPATGSASALYLDESSSRLFQWESPVYVEVGVSGGGTATTSASDLTSGTLADARLSGNVTLNANLRWAMQASSSAIDWLPRGHGVIGAAGASSGSLNLAFFTAPTNSTVTTITFISGGTATASLTLCRFALFTVSETITDGTTLTSPTITMVAQTASDTTIGNVPNTIYSRTFSTAGGYPASYSLVAGSRYAVGFLLVGTTAGTWQAGTVSTGAFMRLPPMAAGNVTSLSDMPTSATTVSLGSYMLYGRIS